MTDKIMVPSELLHDVADDMNKAENWISRFLDKVPTPEPGDESQQALALLAIHKARQHLAYAGLEVRRELTRRNGG